jgi:hypothetical protein
MYKFVQQSRVGIFSQRMHPIHPIGAQTLILVRFEPFRHYTNFGAKRAELVLLMHKLCHEVGSQLFATNTPDPSNQTLN